jgi:hypothetical protein
MMAMVAPAMAMAMVMMTVMARAMLAAKLMVSRTARLLQNWIVYVTRTNAQMRIQKMLTQCSLMCDSTMEEKDIPVYIQGLPICIGRFPVCILGLGPQKLHMRTPCLQMFFLSAYDD